MAKNSFWKHSNTNDFPHPLAKLDPFTTCIYVSYEIETHRQTTKSMCIIRALPQATDCAAQRYCNKENTARMWIIQ